MGDVKKLKKLNKGEWGELYVAIRLLGEGKLYLANEKGEPTADYWMDVLEVIRNETDKRIVKYDINVKDTNVKIILNGKMVTELPAVVFTKAADSLFEAIDAGGSRTFAVPFELIDFFEQAEIIHYKAKSVLKSDIFVTVSDPRASITRNEIGFSIKTMYSQPSTLFNTAAASGFVYRVKGMNDGLMQEINGLTNSKGHADVAGRCSKIISLGCQLEPVGFAVARRTNQRTFAENLDILDARLPVVIERILRDYFFGSHPERAIIEVVDRIIHENPCDITRPEIKYPFMMKSFLYAAYCGMTASTQWDGRPDVNGGLINVTATGDVVAFYALESEAFKSYLFEHCFLDFPSTSRGHGDYAYVYKVDDEYFYNLNFQIRYK